MSDCICEGNWRKIIKESEPLMGREYENVYNEDVFTFMGVVHCLDDYYYCLMNENGKLEMLSCVGSIENYGYELLEN